MSAPIVVNGAEGIKAFGLIVLQPVLLSYTHTVCILSSLTLMQDISEYPPLLLSCHYHCNKRLALQLYSCVLIGLDLTNSKPFEFQTAHPTVLKFSIHLLRVQEHPPVEFHHPPPSSWEATCVHSSKVPFCSSHPKVSILDRRLQTVITRLVVIRSCSSLDTVSSQFSSTCVVNLKSFGPAVLAQCAEGSFPIAAWKQSRSFDFDRRLLGPQCSYSAQLSGGYLPQCALQTCQSSSGSSLAFESYATRVRHMSV